MPRAKNCHPLTDRALVKREPALPALADEPKERRVVPIGGELLMTKKEEKKERIREQKKLAEMLAEIAKRVKLAEVEKMLEMAEMAEMIQREKIVDRAEKRLYVMFNKKPKPKPNSRPVDDLTCISSNPI